MYSVWLLQPEVSSPASEAVCRIVPPRPPLLTPILYTTSMEEVKIIILLVGLLLI